MAAPAVSTVETRCSPTEDPPETRTTRPAADTARSNTLLAVVDQGVVSLTNFVTTVLLARAAGLDELGAYSIAFTLAVLHFSIQESLLVAPYTVLASRCSPRRLHELRAALIVQQALIAAVVSAAFIVVAFLNYLAAESVISASLLACLALAVPSWSFREFVRRTCLAELKPALALRIDTVNLTLQCGGMVLLWSVGQLSAASCLLIIAVASLASGLVWRLACGDLRFVVRYRRFVALSRGNWKFGKWLCASRMLAVMQAYALHWVLVIMADVETAGAFAACLAIIALANPIVMGAGALMAPYAARAFSDHGAVALRRTISKASCYLIAVTCLFAGAVWLMADSLLHWLYDIPASRLDQVVGMLALALLASVIGMGADNGLRAMSRPAANLVASSAGLLAALLIAVPGVPSWGAHAASAGALAGAVTAAAIRCFAFSHHLRTASGGVA